MAAIAISEANLQRGFAVSRDYVPSSGFTFCSGTRIGTHGFGGGLLACQSARLKTVTTPVPIDLAEEERKLASMQSRLVVARELRDRRMNACYQGVSG